jgi:glycosyltransferase involved in cell wall biosynthesis
LGRYLDPRGWLTAAEPPLPEADRAFYAAIRESHSAGLPQPLVTCIMPTYNRRRYVPQAIRYFQRQDFSDSELLILDDGEDRVADLVPADARIRYVPLGRRMILGAKRNHACEMARGQIIVHWDDDDWIAPWRLSYQVEVLQTAGADLCGAVRQLY